MSYAFRQTNKLLTPKPSPVVIPFKKEKIFIIASGTTDGPFPERSPRWHYYEVLDLRSHVPVGLKTPFDKAYDTARHEPFLPLFSAYVIKGDKVYFQIVAEIWRCQPRMFYLDMSSEKWYVCHDPNIFSYMMPGVCYDDEITPNIVELPNFLWSLYGQRKCLNRVTDDFTFSVGVSYLESDGKGRSIFVKVLIWWISRDLTLISEMAAIPASMPPLESVEIFLESITVKI
ncbi:unnamed protein product [Linum trigynum]|uniref:F-box associated domain-containing protein n=1 Tax=Linum trigynum TaxID=586398 RepID=A0AAV2DVP7_9ROSI